jgi:hypothetical protein
MKSLLQALKIFLIIFFLNILVYSNNYKNIIFYIVAHQDDWQLFVGDLAYEDINSDSSKVVFIYTTAGESNLGESYWRAREEGCIESIRFIKDLSNGSEVYGQDTINGHFIHFYKTLNTSSYFLRIPNNKLIDIESGIPYHTVDDSSLYENWNDFYSTLKKLVFEESIHLNEIQIFSHEPDLAFNPYSHVDHRVTGRASIQLQNEIKCDLFLFKDYTTYNNYESNLPVNLDKFSIMVKAGLFISYDKKVYDECKHCTTCEPLGYHYTQWLFRTYISREIFSDSCGIIILSNKNNSLDQFKLYQNFPNPFNQATKIAFDLNKKSKVILAIYTINGNIIKTIENRVLEPGSYQYVWKPDYNSSGLYFFKLRVNNSYSIRRCTLLK